MENVSMREFRKVQRTKRKNWSLCWRIGPRCHQTLFEKGI